ncbi:PREDICTED: uncharacterized protein LOC109300328 [Gavialis gangeticus]|uniref:uncharacterized protein LOC109300328 n=1 Tax=Gavialis gangeticus TaxID=94835 RepID=UPI00092EC478|nr:PREDICTED: uncharacterized protein LOC109300328 [Gavialis gangeticus]
MDGSWEPPPPPPFRSFFAAEVRALLRGRDVSTIEAEPPPPATGPQPGDPRGSATFFLDAARCSLLADGPGPRDPRGSTAAVPGAAQGSLRRDDLELRDPHGSTTFFLDVAQGSLLGDDPEPRDPCSSTAAVPGAARCSLLMDYLGPREPRGSAAAGPGAAQGSSLRDPHGSTTFFLEVARRNMLGDDPEPRDPRGSTTALLDAAQGSVLGDDLEPGDPRSSTTAVLDAAQGSVLGDDLEPRDPRSSTTAVLDAAQGSVLGDDLEPGDPRSSTTAVLDAAQGSVLGDDLEPRDPRSSTTAVLDAAQGSPRDPRSSTTAVLGNPVGKEPAGSSDTTKGRAPARPRVAACSIPTALQGLAPASCSSRRALVGRGCALAGQLSRVSLSSLRLSLQRPVVTRDVPLGSQTEAQPPAQVPAGTAAKQSSARLLGFGKCSTGLRPPSRLPGPGGSRAGPGGLQAPVGMELPGSSKGAGAPGTGLPPRPGSKRQLVKPGTGNPPLPAGAPQPLGATSSPQDRAPGINTTYSASHVQAAAKAAQSRLPPRRAVAGPALATAVAPRSRLRPPAKASASPRSLPPCKRVRLGEGDAAQGPTCRGPMALLRRSPDAAPRGVGAAAPMQSPGNLLHRELEQVQNELELARSELQRVQRELEGARTELVEKDAQCQAYRRVIADLQAQLGAAGSVAEGCRLEA